MAEHSTILTLSEGIAPAATFQLAKLLGETCGVDFAKNEPLICPALMLGHPELAEIARQMNPPEGSAVVHESQSFAAAGRAAMDRPIRVAAKVTANDAVRLFDFDLVDEDGKTLGGMQTRLRFVSPSDMARLKGSKFPSHLDKGNVIWRQSNEFSVSVVSDYLDLANDPNPIHTSDTAARAVGLESAVVPGMFIAGVGEAMLLEALDAVWPASLKLRFMAPVPVGQGVRYGVMTRALDEEGRAKSARVFVLRQDETIAAIGDFDLTPNQTAI